MQFDVRQIVADKSFFIDGMSYIGTPQSNTAMFITKKVENLLSMLDTVNNCLVFAESGLEIPQNLKDKHAVVFSEKPQLEYAEFANKFAEARLVEEKKLKVILKPEGYYQCETAIIDNSSYIEPGCYIGADVIIGRNAYIMSGTVIRHSTIGDNFLCNEHAVIGSNGFTITEGVEGEKIRIPTLGRVIIGNNVEIGAHDNISAGSGGNTVIDDNVKISALVQIGHDAHIHKNVEITAGGIIGGFVVLEKNAFVGLNAVLRNRIVIGANTVIGMGATVTKSVESNSTVVGNPANYLIKNNS